MVSGRLISIRRSRVISSVSAGLVISGLVLWLYLFYARHAPCRVKMVGIISLVEAADDYPSRTRCVYKFATAYIYAHMAYSRTSGLRGEKHEVARREVVALDAFGKRLLRTAVARQLYAGYLFVDLHSHTRAISTFARIAAIAVSCAEPFTGLVDKVVARRRLYAFEPGTVVFYRLYSGFATRGVASCGKEAQGDAQRQHYA